jgi:hypothetical protein
VSSLPRRLIPITFGSNPTRNAVTSPTAGENRSVATPDAAAIVAVPAITFGIRSAVSTLTGTPAVTARARAQCSPHCQLHEHRVLGIGREIALLVGFDGPDLGDLVLAESVGIECADSEYETDRQGGDEEKLLKNGGRRHRT